MAACRELGGGGGSGYHHHAAGHSIEHEPHGGAANADWRRRQLSSDSQQQQLSITLRLAGGGRVSTSGTAKSGWLQASADGGATWGAVCSQRWGTEEASAACRQLGGGFSALGLPRTAASAGFAASVPAPAAAAASPLLHLQNCAGGETNLAACSVKAWGKANCDNEDGVAGVVCLSAVDGSTARIVGGSSPSSGRLEVSLGAGLWGSVCGIGATGKLQQQASSNPSSSAGSSERDSEDDEESSDSGKQGGSGSGDDEDEANKDAASAKAGGGWNAAAATVVCRQLGYSTGVARWVDAAAGGDVPPIVLSGLGCVGNEGSLMGCTRRAWGDAGACAGASRKVAAVQCSGVLDVGPSASPGPSPTPVPSPTPSPYGPYSGSGQPPNYGSPSPSPSPSPAPPTDVLPSGGSVSLVLVGTASQGEVTSVIGNGLVKFLAPSPATSTSSSSTTTTTAANATAPSTASYLCADPWGGWDNAAASAACRMAGYAAGGAAVKVWRAGDLPPLLLGRLTCSGYETDLSQCTVSAAPGISANGTWQLAAAAPAGACKMLAAVRCWPGAAVTLRAATAPAPSSTTAVLTTTTTTTTSTAAANSTTSTNSTTTTSNQTAVIARLEASVGGAAYGAVCSDGGFDAAAADVACRTLGYANGGVIYAAGAPAAPRPNATDPTATGTQAVPAAQVDADGSYLGTLASVRCGGSEAGVGGCAAWRATSAGGAVPCRAAAWVACRLPPAA
ncbi:hypothetical protein HYH02_003284 [Chlamydomonas schloesseri]|uniref:SRCR domain-containing protein n=1 Tax=Chlamydomonas schloesseri TaxID=2026947 RepID=A0A835WRA7_9CHLO|nr:hypothetical protein HYH02_003284 [Chlamydomonas schloesseri]|eukprot:KAG2452260.1 hypothetical protein HYH02_003284 [Chlamydomonas schloesseri]